MAIFANRLGDWKMTARVTIRIVAWLFSEVLGEEDLSFESYGDWSRVGDDSYTVTCRQYIYRRIFRR